MRITIMAGVLAALVALLTACGGGSNSGTDASASSSAPASDSGSKGKQEVTLVWNETDVSNGQLKVLLDEFNKKYPDIKVNRISVTSSGWADYFNKIQTMIAGGKAPDVIRVAIEGIQMFAKQDLLLPLDDYMKQFPDAVENYDDLHPKLQSPFVIDGKTYGFVWDWNNVVMHFNTDLLKEAGLPVPPADWTRDDFLQYAQALTTDKGGKKTFGFEIPNYYFGASAWLFNNDASVLDPTMTTSKLDDPNAIEVMQFFQDLVYKYKVAPVPNPKADMINDLITGRVAMISAGKWPFATYDKTKFKAVDVQFLPKLKTQKVIFGSGAFPVLKSAKNPEAAFKLSAFLSSSFSQKTTLSNSSIPTRISVMNEVLPQTPASNWRVYADSADIAQPVEAPMQYGSIEGIFNRYMSSILSNQMDAATAMKKAKAEIDAALAKK
ncbi:ABC transporter substrate-binding protein [Cohnella zeiphila]|uniref:Sugar ABC transporter substrate-binding protein n=1 Tax=Cohnella zeiphila TaxID=2761120 RepID=A0A7X0SMZ0_9BACL|nr:sugar ABC transporter substrate-binding protein [Cohnella zeiphila]MBB6732965.1 sugar ABC transporter substrate-binding protein [Cohnella zeiphila]